MACNVFGCPITDSTLEDMREYEGKNITRKDRAHVAMLTKEGNKYAHARRYVESLQKSGETEACKLCTLCLIYNATGDPVTYQHHKDWSGKMGPAPPFPVTIANGQWGAFLHVSTTAHPNLTRTATGSIAGIVYRGRNDAGILGDWLLCWYNPRDRTRGDHNRAYADVKGIPELSDYFPDHWDDVYDLLKIADPEKENTWNGCVSSATIETSTTTPVYEGTMTLEGA